MTSSSPLAAYSEYLDGRTLSEDEVRSLRAWIAADPQNASAFVELGSLHAAVTDRLALVRLLDDLAGRRAGRTITAEILEQAIRGIESNSPRIGPPPREPESLPVAEPSAGFAAWAAVAASLCVAAGMLYWSASRSSRQAVPVEPRRSSATPIVASTRPAPPPVVATLSTSIDARWSDAGVVATGTELTAGTRMILEDGVVQFDMRGGAKLVVEGPTALELTGPDSVRLARGKVAARVAEDRESFIVDTPTIKVVDLGTEFGVETSERGAGRVAVFEGRVALADLSADAATAVEGPNQVTAGFEAVTDVAETGPAAVGSPTALHNDRYFLRPDEVETRLRSANGSVTDRRLAAHFERQRIAGLLAYQGFDRLSSGAEYAVGVQAGGPTAGGEAEYLEQEGELSGRMQLRGGQAFMVLDVSPAGVFGRAGLLADSGRIGRTGRTLWLTWQTQRVGGEVASEGSAGLSLMLGGLETHDEPVFFGRCSGGFESHLALETGWGGAAPPAGRRVTVDVDSDRDAAGVQPLTVGDDRHLWIARIEFLDGLDHVSIWMDVEFADVEAVSPQAVLSDVDVEFDRIRLAVNREQESWQFGEFAVALSPEALDRLGRVGNYRVDR